MLFAHLKRILRLGRLRLRGPNGAKDEFLLAATAQNLRKLAKLIPHPTPILPHEAQRQQFTSPRAPQNSKCRRDNRGFFNKIDVKQTLRNGGRGLRSLRQAGLHASPPRRTALRPKWADRRLKARNARLWSANCRELTYGSSRAI
jgi:hypothetical protein